MKKKMNYKTVLLVLIILFSGMIIFAQTTGNEINRERETIENHPKYYKDGVLVDKSSESADIKLGIAFGDGFNNELFMPYIRDLGADVSLIKLRWQDVEPYPPNDPRYVFDTTILDNFLAQLQCGDTVLINVFTASHWATNQTCENNTQSKGCPLKDYATCLADYGVTCEQAYRDFIYNLVLYANDYLSANNIDAEIMYWQRDTEPAATRHFPCDEPEVYVALQRYFYKSVNSADPDAKVVGVCANGALTGNIDVYGNLEPNNPDFFRYVIANTSEYFDLLDIRFYQDIYTIPERLGWFLQEMENNGYRKPVITTECGGPTSMEFTKHYGTVLFWCGSHGYTEETQLYDCLYDMDLQGLLQEEIAIFMPYDPLSQISVLNEEKVERMLCRDITQRTLILLENNVTKHWRWNLRAKKLNFCADDDIDVYGSLVFNKLAFLRYPGVICNENSPSIPEKRETSYECYQRMQEKFECIKNVERLNLGNSDIFLYKVNKFDGTHIFVVWEKRDIFYGEDKPSTPFEFTVNFANAKITDVFGNEEIKFSHNGVLSLDITDTPLFIEGTKTIKRRR